MKYKKNITLILSILCASAQHIKPVLTVSQYKPDSTLQKPYLSQDDYTSIPFIFSAGFAPQAFNNKGERVDFLSQFGSEDLLKRFVDPTLALNNTESMGQGKLSGEFHVQEAILSSYKSIKNGFFIEAATAIQALQINEISVHFVDNEQPLSDQETIYLEALQRKTPHTIHKSGMFTTAVYGGYNKTFAHFERIDFIDMTMKVGFTSPEVMSKKNNDFMQFPFYENIHFGYPIVMAASMGALDWMTIGCNGSITPWQSARSHHIPYNNADTKNTLLLPQKTSATLTRGPLLTTAIYFEADHVFQGFSATIAYNYAKNYAYTITPTDKTIIHASQSDMLNDWSMGSLYVQLDIDFASYITPSAPILTLFCNIPLAGTLSTKTNLLGGACALQISYNF